MKMFFGYNDSRAAVHACLERKKPLQFTYSYTEWGIVVKRTQENISVLGDFCICLTVAVLRFLCNFAPYVTTHLILKLPKPTLSSNLSLLSLSPEYFQPPSFLFFLALGLKVHQFSSHSVI